MNMNPEFLEAKKKLAKAGMVDNEGHIYKVLEIDGSYIICRDTEIWAKWHFDHVNNWINTSFIDIFKWLMEQVEGPTFHEKMEFLEAIEEAYKYHM